jgi:hypothetical protein
LITLRASSDARSASGSPDDTEGIGYVSLGLPCPDLKDITLDTPESIVAIIGRMLQKEPSARYGTVRDILANLDDGELTMVCDDCGAENPVANRYCGKCGKPFGAGAVAGEDQPATQTTADSLVEQGFALGQQGDWIGSIRKYREAIAIDAQHSKAHANLGFALNHLGLYEEAKQVLTDALELGEHPALYSYRAFSNRNLRQYEAALADLEKAREDRPHDPRIYKDMASCLIEIGEPEKAYSAVLLALRYDPRNERLLTLRRQFEITNPDIMGIIK